MQDNELLTQLIFSFDSSVEKRRSTFSHGKLPFRSPTVEALVDAGFYHVKDDTVQCWACSVLLDGWEPHDDPIDEHRKHSPDCPLFNLSDRNNPTVEEVLEIKIDRFRNDIVKNYIPYALSKHQRRLQRYTEEVLEVKEALKKGKNIPLQRQPSIRTKSQKKSSNV